MIIRKRERNTTEKVKAERGLKRRKLTSKITR
jgi:hypothetical protein